MRVIHVVGSRSWDDKAEGALRAALAMRAIGFAQSVIITDNATSLHTFYAAHGLEVYPMTLHGFGSIFTPARLGNMLLREPSSLLHLHDLALTRIAVGAITIARPEGARMVVNASAVETEQLDPRRRAMIAAEGVVVAPLLPVGFNVLAPREVEATDAALRMLIIGELTKESGVADVIDTLLALSEPTRLRITVVGSGKGNYVMPLLRKLRKAKLDGRVEWLGDKAIDDDLWRAHDLLLLPSSEPGDGVVLAPLAMAQGLGVVALDTPSHRSLAMRSALLYLPDGNESLADRLNMLLDNPEILAALRQQHLAELSNRPTPEEFAADLRTFYTRLMQ